MSGALIDRSELEERLVRFIREQFRNEPGRALWDAEKVEKAITAALKKHRGKDRPLP